MNASEFALGILASFTANLLSALAGGGSGLFLLPALLLLDIPFPIALASHKIATVGLGVGAASRHWQEHTVTAKFCLYLLVVGGPGVALGAQLATAIPEQLAELILGSLILGLGVISHRFDRTPGTITRSYSERTNLLIGGGGLFVIGVLNGVLTSGTGLLFTF